MSTADRIANAEQIQYWNEQGGPSWVRFQQLLDKQLDPLGMAAMEAASIEGTEKILDIGCGCGSTTLLIARQLGRGGHAVGVDISRPMLELARQRAQAEHISNVEFQEADAQTHRFPEEEYDILFSRFGVMFFDNPTVAFDNMRRALRPGGHLAFVCWQAPQKNLWMSVPMMVALKHITIDLPTSPDAPGPFAFADPDKVHHILHEAGFSGISMEKYDRDITIGGGGDLNQAVDFIMDLGPVSRALTDAPQATREAVRSEIAEAFKDYYGPKGVRMPSAAWIVTADN